MNTATMKLSLLITACALAGAGTSLGAGCGSSNAAPATSAPPAASSEVLARGEYLVKTVAGCGECHTPHDAAGNLDQSKWLAGVPNRFDLVPNDDAAGAISTPNLTPYALSGWSDAEIKSAIVDGRSATGRPLLPLMPSYVFHNMTGDDANAIVAYLRAVPPVANDLPAPQPLPLTLDAPAEPLPEGAIPHTTLRAGEPGFKSAERGRYLAAMAGLCIDCHSTWRLDARQPLQLDTLFAGGRAFSSKDWGIAPPAPPVVYAYNITPDATGIQNWDANKVADALKKGVDDQGNGLCRPMPSGPMGSLAALTDSDALDIGAYLSTLPAVVGEAVAQCTTTPPPPSTDGGVDGAADAASEAGAPDATTPPDGAPPSDTGTIDGSDGGCDGAADATTDATDGD